MLKVRVLTKGEDVSHWFRRDDGGPVEVTVLCPVLEQEFKDRRVVKQISYSDTEILRMNLPDRPKGNINVQAAKQILIIGYGGSYDE